jgi:hypothetical protein
MGVTGSHCQLCRLPLQHDHYVRAANASHFKIYRGTGGTEKNGGHTWEAGERVVVFGPEHAWLTDAIGLGRSDAGVALVEGPVSDGILTDRTTGAEVFVGEGDEDALTYHRYCWEQFGAPREAGAAHRSPRGHGTYGWAVIGAFGGQLFELAELIDGGLAWTLVDPRGDSPDATTSRARIAGLLADTSRGDPPRGPPPSIAHLLAVDRDWNAAILRKDGVSRSLIHYRDDLHPALDRSAYSTLVWAMTEYGGTGLPDATTGAALAEYEAALKAAVETNATAILVMSTAGDGQAQWLIYSKDEGATRAAIDSLPRGASLAAIEYDNTNDPTWAAFFDEMNPRRYLA